MDPETIANISRAVTSAVIAALAGSSSDIPVSEAVADSENVEKDDVIRKLKLMLGLKLSITEISRQLGLSRPTIYKHIKQYELEANKFADITDNRLDHTIKVIKEEHPAAGQIMLQGHLRAVGIHVQRSRLRQSLFRVDSEGIEQRRLRTIRRRRYSVKGPNFLWHIDGTHKLIRWRLVVHASIDGFSRIITFAQCSNNNRAETVLQLFEKSCRKYGYPLRIRTDQGGENVLVWEKLRELYREDTNPVIVGSSVHNQRIERLHRDINEQVINKFYNLFYSMEGNGYLNPENTTDLFCLHYVFISIISRSLHEFILAHNNHNISTEHSFTPLQLFMLNYNIREDQIQPDQEFLGGIAVSALDNNNLPYVNVLAIISPLTEEEYAELIRSVDPLSYSDPVEAFRDVVAFVVRYV